MGGQRTGQVAVIFVSQRTSEDEAGYQKVTAQMEALATEQPGYCGIEATRDANGFGITVSYWANDDAAKAWRDNETHAAIREEGRGRWYESYHLTVAEVTRDYAWHR